MHENTVVVVGCACYVYNDIMIGEKEIIGNLYMVVSGERWTENVTRNYDVNRLEDKINC